MICYDELIHFKHKGASMGSVKNAGTGSLWFVGFIGALIYFLHIHSGTFWLVVLAVIKAIVWPAVLVYSLLLSLHV